MALLAVGITLEVDVTYYYRMDLNRRFDFKAFREALHRLGLPSVNIGSNTSEAPRPISRQGLLGFLVGALGLMIRGAARQGLAQSVQIKRCHEK